MSGATALITRARTLAIVANWNGAALTERCLIDLAASRAPVDVVVIDNASTDDSVARIARLALPHVETIVLPDNRGFAAAINVGLDRARSDAYEFVWMLNNDVRIPPGCHEALLDAAEHEPGAAVWTPALESSSGERQHVGGVWARDGSRARLITSCEGPASAHEQWLTGTALFCAVSTATQIGSLDESYFVYWEDVDWSFRATSAHVRLRVAPGATLTHVGSSAGGGRGSTLSNFLLARNEVLFLRKHVAPAWRRPALLRVIARQLRWALLLDRRYGAGMADAVVAGALAGLAGQRGRPQMVPTLAVYLPAVSRRALTWAHALERAADRLAPTDHGAACANTGATDAS